MAWSFAKTILEMSSSFTFERESILRPSIDCLFKAREKEQREKIQTDRQHHSSSNCGKIVKLCLLSCVSHSSTHKQTNTQKDTHTQTHLQRHTHATLYRLPHTHVTVLKTHLDTGQQAKNNLQNERKKKQLNSR